MENFVDDYSGVCLYWYCVQSRKYWNKTSISITIGGFDMHALKYTRWKCTGSYDRHSRVSFHQWKNLLYLLTIQPTAGETRKKWQCISIHMYMCTCVQVCVSLYADITVEKYRSYWAFNARRSAVSLRIRSPCSSRILSPRHLKIRCIQRWLDLNVCYRSQRNIPTKSE